MTREEMIEQLENTILLIQQNGKDWWDERDIPILKEAIKSMQTESCQAVLDKAKYYIVMQETKTGYIEKRGYFVDIDDIKTLQSVKPEQRWIPCKKKLPEVRGYYLTTILCENGYHRKREVVYFGDDRQWATHENVTAWIEIPEPYKEETK